MAEIIDNENKKLADRLNSKIESLNQNEPNTTEVDIATAYFNVGGFELVKDNLEKVKKLRLLLGREPYTNLALQDEIINKIENKTDFSNEIEMDISDEIDFYEEDENYFKNLSEAYEFFSRENIEVKKVEGEFFHGKAYIGRAQTQKELNGFAVTGSSNFTRGGLSENKELNMLTTEESTVKELTDWYERMWNDARDYKKEFLEFLNNYIFYNPPEKVVIKALYEYYKDKLEEGGDFGSQKLINELNLKLHQKLTVAQAIEILDTYNGVIIADPVGTGKTRSGLALIFKYVSEGYKPLIICPKSVELTWTQEEKKVHLPYEIKKESVENISRSPDLLLHKYNDCDFIVIDEGHYFRSSSTNRYAALREFLIQPSESGKIKKVVFLTATPVNNSLMDLYNLISFFAPENVIHGRRLRDIFVEQQKKLIEGKEVNLDEVLTKFVIKLPKKQIARLSNLKTAKRIIRNYRYKMDLDPEELYKRLQELDWKFYDMAVEKGGELILPTGTSIDPAVVKAKKEGLKELVKLLVISNLIRRAESSLNALDKSLENLEKYILKIQKHVNNNKFVPPKYKNKISDFSEEIPEEYVYDITDEEKNELVKSINFDMDKIKHLRNDVKNWMNNDTKFNKLVNVINEFKKTNFHGLIIFTSYTDTASYLFDRLSEIYPKEIYLVTGEEKKGIDSNGVRLKDQDDIIETFQNNGGILISTDVLSAGQNLQKANHVINYDFPWNPVVVIQRIGRIDRMNTEYDEIYIHHISPEDQGFHNIVSVMEKITTKLEGIRGSIGTDDSIFGEDPIPKSFTYAVSLFNNDNVEFDTLDDWINLEKNVENFLYGYNPLSILLRIMDELGKDWLENIPEGIGAFKEHPDINGTFVLYKIKGKNGNEYHGVLTKKVGNGNTCKDYEINVDNWSEIIEICLGGGLENLQQRVAVNTNQKIPYNQVIQTLRDAKLKYLECKNIIPKHDKQYTAVKNKFYEIYNSTHEREGEVFKNLDKFVRNTLVNYPNYYNKLYDLINDKDNFLKQLESLASIKNIEEEQIKPEEMKRIAWCIIGKNISFV